MTGTRGPDAPGPLSARAQPPWMSYCFRFTVIPFASVRVFILDPRRLAGAAEGRWC